MVSSSVLFVIAAVVASVVVPFIVYHFRRSYVPERWNEIQRHLKTGDLASTYVALFAPALGTKGDGLDVVKDYFHSSYSRSRYFVPVLLTFVATLAQLLVCGIWCEHKLRGASDGVSVIPEPIIMAILGGYVWSLYELLGRHRSGDLTPVSLYGIALRVIGCVPIGYAFSLLSVDNVQSFFAFAAGAFPVRDLRRMLRRHFVSQLKAEAPRARGTQDHLGQELNGLSDDTLARLDEIQIRTTLDLAYADPLKIFLHTGFPVRHVIDWIDQALLGVYVDGKLGELRLMGIRGAIEASTFYDEHCLDETKHPKTGIENDEEVKVLAKVLGVDPRSALRMLDQVSGDPHTEFISVLWGEQNDEH